MKLIIIRHGETFENILNILQGQSKGRLNNVGIEQTKKLALRLKNEKIDVVYVSDLKRTALTAKEVLKYHPYVKVNYSKPLQEKSGGIYEGKPREEAHKAREIAGLPFYEFKPPGGESLIEVQERVKKFYKSLINKYEDKTVLIITHGGIISLLLLYLFNKPFEEFKNYFPNNTGVTILEIEKNRKPKVVVLNCTKHLN